MQFNKLQAVGLFLAFDGTSKRNDHFTSEKKNAVFIRNKSLFSSGYECIPIRAHAMVAKQRMPQGLSNTDYRIWENINYVGLRGIL